MKTRVEYNFCITQHLANHSTRTGHRQSLSGSSPMPLSSSPMPFSPMPAINAFTISPMHLVPETHYLSTGVESTSPHVTLVSTPIVESVPSQVHPLVSPSIVESVPSQGHPLVPNPSKPLAPRSVFKQSPVEMSSPLLSSTILASSSPTVSSLSPNVKLQEAVLVTSESLPLKSKSDPILDVSQTSSTGLSSLVYPKDALGSLAGTSGVIAKVGKKIVQYVLKYIIPEVWAFLKQFVFYVHQNRSQFMAMGSFYSEI